MSKVAGWTKDEWAIVTNSSAEKEMKVLVTGASGLLGRQIMATLREEGVPCLGLCYSRTSDSLTRQSPPLSSGPLIDPFSAWKPTLPYAIKTQ